MHSDGIFSGIFCYMMDASVETLSEFIGQPVLSAIVTARDNSAKDFARWRKESPSEISRATSRGLANRISDSFVSHMVAALDGIDDVVFREQGISRSFVVREKVVLICKRHNAKDKISSYPTRAALGVWGGVATLEGMETISLAAGYRWDKELREIGVPVLSYRNGLRARPVWVADLSRDEGGAAAPVHIVSPTGPSLPTLDLSDFGQERKDGKQP
jgi:hypothetical protein